MSSTTSTFHGYLPYHPSGTITVIPPRHIQQCVHLCPLLTLRPSKPVSRDPLLPHRPLRMSAQQDPPIPSGSSSWTKETLGLLNAKYETRLISDFPIDVEGADIPEDLQISTTRFPKVAKCSH